MFSFIIFLFNYVILLIVFASGENDLMCTKVSPCECKFLNGNGINLSSLSSLVNYTSSDGKLKYFFHPCSDVPLGDGTVHNNECIGGATLCFYNSSTNSYTKLGTANGVTFITNNLNYPISMRYIVNNVTSIVKLVCGFDTNSFLTGLPINTSYHELTLTSVLACPVSINNNTTPATTTVGTVTPWPDHSSHSLSTGSVLVIIFFVISGLYFIGGALALKFLRGASGKEMIPNYDFWVDLPYLCRDGILFVLYGCKVPPSYERI